MRAWYFVSNEHVCVVLSLFAGVLGIKVKIMLPWDPSGKIGPKKPLPDHVSIVEPKEEILPTTPISEQKGGKPEQPAMPQPVPTAWEVSACERWGNPCGKGVLSPKKLSGSQATGNKNCWVVPDAVMSWVGFRVLPRMKGVWCKVHCEPATHTLQWRWDDESERKSPCPSALYHVVFCSMDLGTLGHSLSDFEAFVWEGFVALDVFTFYHLRPLCSWQQRLYIPHIPPPMASDFG